MRRRHRSRRFREAQRVAILRRWEAFRASCGVPLDQATKAFRRSLQGRRPSRATLYGWRAKAAAGSLSDGRLEVAAARRRIARRLANLPLAKLLIIEAELVRATVLAEAGGAGPVAKPTARTGDEPSAGSARSRGV